MFFEQDSVTSISSSTATAYYKKEIIQVSGVVTHRKQR